MGAPTGSRARARAALPIRVLAVVLIATAIFAIAAPVGSLAVGGTPVPRASLNLVSPENGSSGGDPSGSSASVLCPSAGPVILGVQWNCVAVLDLTELALILLSIGIVAFVFRDADRAELPGESAEVPVTAEEWAEYQRTRKLGIPYEPRKPPGGEGGN